MNETNEILETLPEGATRLEANISLTQKAAEQINKLKQVNNIKDMELRINVRGGGCSGFSYGMTFDKPRETDKVIESEGITIYIDCKTLFYIDGTIIDYTDGLDARGFVFKNPNATHVCGCGNSFGL